MKKIFVLIVISSALFAIGWYSLYGPIQAPPEESTFEIEAVPNIDLAYTAQNIGFTEIETDIVHNFDSRYFSFLGGAVLDLDDNETDELYVTQGAGQNDAYLIYENGLFIDRIADLGINNTQASYGVETTDIDNDGDTDLIIARQDGLYIYYRENSKYAEYRVPVSMPTHAIPVDIAAGDIDNDGDTDLYIPTFITGTKFRSGTFNDPSHVQTNIMLRNDGDRVFTDITIESGLEYAQNTFTASFVELNGDEYIDLVVSPNTDQVRIYQNIAGVFTLQSQPSTYGFWMGLGIDDIDNDGDVDLFLSNSGTTVPKRLATGDLRDGQKFETAYTLLQNDGDFVFSDITNTIDAELPFGWGIVAHDFNADNKQEWLLMHNYIKWPPHKIRKGPGMLLRPTKTGYADAISGSGLENKYFGFSALSGDFTGDSITDIAYLNVDGPIRIMKGTVASLNNELRIIMPENSSVHGMRFELSMGGTTIRKTYAPKQGIMTDQSPIVYFSLGNQTHAILKTIDRFGNENMFDITDQTKTLDLR